MPEKLPATVLSGLLGAGRTTLLNLLTDSEYAAGEQDWLSCPDPLPPWELADTH